MLWKLAAKYLQQTAEAYDRLYFYSIIYAG